MLIYYILSICQWQYTNSKLYVKNVCFAGFHIDTSIGTAVQVLQPYPYLHTSVFSTNFLPRPGQPFILDFILWIVLWSLLVYILPWCCACISCKSNKLTILYSFTFKQKSQWIICTINFFLCIQFTKHTYIHLLVKFIKNVDILWECDSQSERRIFYIQALRCWGAIIDVTNRKIPCFKQ